MQGKALPGHRAFELVVPQARAKRVDLVVTDYDFSSDPGRDSSADGMQQEFRCTIPLALLADSISSETLREVARVCQPWCGTPIGADEFMHLVTDVVSSLKEPPAGRCDGQAVAITQRDSARVARLTQRERQVLHHVVAGDPNKTTAAALHISRRTVEHHRAAIMQKTRTRSVSELVRLALRTSLVDTAELGDG